MFSQHWADALHKWWERWPSFALYWWPGIHLTHSLWARNPISAVKIPFNVVNFFMDNQVTILCAKLWPGLVIVFHTRAASILLEHWIMSSLNLCRIDPRTTRPRGEMLRASVVNRLNYKAIREALIKMLWSPSLLKPCQLRKVCEKGYMKTMWWLVAWFHNEFI